MEKSKITVSKNGKHTGFNDPSKKDTTERSHLSHKEDALGKDSSINMFARPDERGGKIRQFPIQKKGNVRTFRPIIVAIVCALVIGTGLGVIMLNMITNINDQVSHGSVQNIPPVANDNTEREQTEETKKQHTTVALESISAHVLQGGVFTEQENAEASAKLFDHAGFPTSIWNRDDNYYLFVGLAKTKEQAQEIGSEMTDDTLEIFVKEWTTKQTELSLTDEEQSWIQSFVKVWNESLDGLSEPQEEFPIENWQALADKFPDDTTSLTNLGALVNDVIDQDNKEISIFSRQHMLLMMWKQYDALHTSSQ